MELEGGSNSAILNMHIRVIPLEMINPLGNICRLQIVENLTSHYQQYSFQIVKAYIKKSKFLETFDFLHSTFLFKNGLFADELVNQMDSLLCKPAEEVYFHEAMPLFRDVTMKSKIDKADSYQHFVENFGIELLLKNDGDSGWDVFCLNYNFPDDMKPVVDSHMELML